MRATIAADSALVKGLADKAREQNKSLYAMTNEAIEMYLQILGFNKRFEDVVKILRLFEIYAATGSVPLPETLLDKVLQLTLKAEPNREELYSEWVQHGRMVGEVVKGFVPSLEELSSTCSELAPYLPPSLLKIVLRDGVVEVIMTGAGYSAEASRCTGHGITGFLSAYNCSTEKLEVSEGFVKVIARRTEKQKDT